MFLKLNKVNKKNIIVTYFFAKIKEIEYTIKQN